MEPNQLNDLIDNQYLNNELKNNRSLFGQNGSPIVDYIGRVGQNISQGLSSLMTKTTNDKQPSLVGGTGDADTVSKNQSNNPLFMGIGMDSVNKALNVGSGIMTVSSYIAGQDAYDKTIDKMEEALSEMSSAKTQIGGQFSSDLLQLQDDFSQRMQTDAVSTMRQNRGQFQEIENINTDFNSGQIQGLKENLLQDINTRLEATADSQRLKLNEVIDNMQDRAIGATDKISSSMKSVEGEIKKVKEAKRQSLRNTLTEVAALASTAIDPTGITGGVLRATKFENEYS
tara:strand:+ start:890 stop:1747 length:858 start_codon:yes stop_codon:yes gene_type:complete